MIIGSFGPIVFEVGTNRINTFRDLSHKEAFETQSVEVKGKKPSTANKGPSLSTLSFVIQLYEQKNLSVAKEDEKWSELVQSGIAYPLIIGGKPFKSGKWKVKSVSRSDYVHGPNGNPIEIKLSIELEEYVREGKAQTEASSNASTGGSSGGRKHETILALTASSDKQTLANQRLKV